MQYRIFKEENDYFYLDFKLKIMVKWKKGIQSPNPMLIPKAYTALPKTLTICNSNGKKTKEVIKIAFSF
jgi:hypothetical protein